MNVSEASRADLYNGLVDVLGNDRAETLMSYLSHDPEELATKADLAVLKTELKTELKVELKAELKAEFDPQFAELREGLVAVNARLDRLFQTLVAGLFVIVAAMAGVLFSTL